MENIPRIETSDKGNYAWVDFTHTHSYRFVSENTSPLDGWLNPTPIDVPLPPVDEFEYDFLPLCFRPWVKDVSERTQTPPDFAAAAAVFALAGSVNRRAEVQPRQRDTTWIETLNAWGAIIARPGFIKSPVIHEMTRPLHEIEAEWRASYRDEKRAFDELVAEYKQNFRDWSKEKKGNRPVPPIEPRARRLVTSDSTAEKLHEVMIDNPAGMCVISDELTGWWSIMEKRGREGERQFHLTAWNGYSSYTMDRVGRGSVHAPHVCESVFGGIQPASIRRLLETQDRDDGMIQRTQIMVWPDSTGWRLVDRPFDNKARETYRQVLKTLANRTANKPIRLLFDAEAQQLFNDWLEELEKKIYSDVLSPAFISHISKYRGLMPTLAALFELADRVVEDEMAQRIRIDPAHCKQSIAFCQYLMSHANRVYSASQSPERNHASSLLIAIRAGRLGRLFATRQVYRLHRRGLDSPERATAALRLLEEHGWIRQTAGESRMGRPSETWDVNPMSFYANAKVQ